MLLLLTAPRYTISFFFRIKKIKKKSRKRRENRFTQCSGQCSFIILIMHLVWKDNEIIVQSITKTYMVAVAVKWSEPEFTCQLNGSATVQREPTRVREASEGLRGAEFCGLVAGVNTMLLSRHQSATNSHQIQRRRTCSLIKELTLKEKEKKCKKKQSKP